MTGTAERFDLIVLGGGPAGVTAALRGAELGARVALVEKDRLGGTCTNDGCVPTRVLAKAARLLRDARQLDDYGITADAPTLDLGSLIEATQRTVYRLHEKKQLAAHLERAGVDVREGSGQAAFLGHDAVRLGDGATLEADRFVIACGGHPRRLEVPGAELAMTHGDVWRLRTVPGSIAVVGGSATGAQLASIFAAFGSQVSLLEMAPRLLAGEDPDVSAAIAAAFTEQGLDVTTGIRGIEAIRRAGGGLALAYGLDSRTRVLAVDAVLLAVGWPGNLEGLGLEAAGVATERGYVRVDDALRTSAPTIWAAGDITGRMMLVQSATFEGRIAAENALRGASEDARHAVVAHGGFTDPEYASVGMTQVQAAHSGGDPVVGLVRYADLDRAVVDGRTVGFCKLVVAGESHRILGAHVVGEQAVEVVQIAAAAMAGDVPVERLAEVEFAYPTFTAIVGLAARQVVHALRMPVDQARAWEALGRPRVAEWERTEG